MNAPDSVSASKAPLYISPILQRVEKNGPDPSVACATCPASMWFATTQLKCFCSRMHSIVWDGAQEPIVACDGRELALMAIEQEQAEKAERKAQAAQTREDRKVAWKEAALEHMRERFEAAGQQRQGQTSELGEVPPAS
jgi:hypothetical protein